MIERPRVIDVVRKPRKCPVCGELIEFVRGGGIGWNNETDLS